MKMRRWIQKQLVLQVLILAGLLSASCSLPRKHQEKPLSNPHNSEFRFEKLTTVNSILVPTSADIYKIEVTNLPPNTYFILSRFPDYFNEPAEEKLITNSNGDLCKISNGIILEPGDWFEYVKNDPGLKTTFFLTSSDGQIKITDSLIPNPVEQTFTDGAKVSLHFRNSEYTVVEIDCMGFTWGEEIEIDSYSVDERLVNRFSVPRDGKIVMLLSPEVINHTQGDALVVVRRATESIEIPYHWDINRSFARISR